MSTAAQIVDVIFIALVLGMILFWIFIVPQRARKQRRAEPGSSDSPHHQAWERNIGTSRRER